MRGVDRNSCGFDPRHRHQAVPAPKESEINKVRNEGKRKMVWAATIWMWLTSDGFGIMLVGAVLLEIVILIAAFNTKK